MPLVDYASSDDEDDDPPAIANAPPPLPAAFHDLYAGAARLSNADNPALHGGRVRAIPHVPGNWSTHVYLEWHPTTSEHELLASLLASLDLPKAALTSFLSSDLDAPQPLHSSLSAPLVLRTETKDSFLAAITGALARVAPRIPSPLALRPTGLAWHPNAEGTRGFLVLRMAPEGELRTLLDACNDVAVEFGCAMLYPAGTDGGKFHISIAWGLDVELFPAGDIEVPAQAKQLLTQLRDIDINFTDVKVKIGRDVTSVALGRARRIR